MSETAREAAGTVDEEIRPEDSASNHHSSTSSSVSARRKELNAKKAALQAEAAILDEQHQLEMDQARIKMKLEQLSIKRRLAMVEAEEAMSHDSVSVTTPQAELQAESESDPEITFKQSDLNHAVEEFVPTMDKDVVTWLKQSQIQNAQLIETIKLPTAQLQSFSGDPIHYWPFIRAFESCVASSMVDDGAKLLRLLQYCTGPARKVVECCMVMPPAAGYVRALELLKERFGNEFMILQSWIKKITSGVPVKDRSQLRQFADDLMCCKETLQAIHACSEINNQATLLKIVERLPSYLQNRWKREVAVIRSKSKMPDIDDVVTFVVNAAAEANDPVFGHLNTAVRPEVRGRKHDTSATMRSTSMLTGCSESRESDGKLCILCTGRHPLFRCSKFIGMKLDDRLKYASDKKLCYNCLSVGHISAKCKSSYLCQVPGCNRKHSKYLHRVKSEVKSTNAVDVSAAGDVMNDSVESVAQCTSTGAGSTTQVALPIVPVMVSTDQHDGIVSTYALLDSGSTNSFCSAKLVNDLHVVGKKSLLSLTTLDRTNSVTEMQSVSLKVTAVSTGHTVVLPAVYVRPKIYVNGLETVKSADLTQWSHLSHITFPDVDINQISLLIGQDAPEALMPLEVSRGNTGDPYAVRTPLGWCINGPIGKSMSAEACVNFLSSEQSLEQQVERFWKLETSEQEAGQITHSVNDRKAIEMWEQSIKIDGGHYEMTIPFKQQPNFPDNKAMALKRLGSLRKSLIRNPKIMHDYKSGINDMLMNGYAVKLSDAHMSRADGAVWYLPHHGVIHPRKQKLRIVFDCAAKFEGVSLNDCILQGPDLTSKLVGVLARFRQERIAIMADIKAMFCQVHVTPKDQDVLRFLWWPNGDMDRDPEVYRMTIHLFGGVWSPSCASFALLRTADDNRSDFPDIVINCVRRNFYVDDFLKSIPNQTDAVMVVNQLTELLSRGGFHLTKWVSNSREVLEAVAEDDRSEDVKSLDLSQDRLPAECALGVFWDIETDSFSFRSVNKNKPFTRRGILSVVSSVYDPLGLLCPFVFPAKVIVQDLCRNKYGWDDELSPDDVVRWLQWLEDLPKVEQVKVRRCFKPPDNCEVSKYSLHHFCDASQIGYGVASYVRMESAAKQAHCCLVLGKSRLSPIKSTTIPRLELMAAALAVKMDKMLRSELDYEIQESVFWTDSTIVLRYVANSDRRFHTFVANRVSAILDGSEPANWRHVPSKLNPADDVSRGLRIDDLMSSSRWFTGPHFLCRDETCWPVSCVTTTDTTGLELKKETISCVTVSQDSGDIGVQRLLNRYSSWYKLKKAVAWLLRVKTFLLNRVRNEQVVLSHDLSVDEIQQAERAIIKFVQQHSFVKELKHLNNHCDELLNTGRYRDLQRLSPILSTDGILCVGGRLRRAQISEETKHPMIVPKNSAIAKLIVRHYHAASNHSGQEHTLALLRERFWIVKARRVVNSELKACYQCKKRAARICRQKMADLPVDRVTPNKPPFTYVGVDYFGPFMVKQGRSLVKRYGCVFTCLSMRAIHLEVANSLDTDSFINALRRFACRRGPPEIIRSDNGSNFVGAEKELRKAVKELNQAQIAEHLRQKEITWIFNPPGASHMGGVWERMIRSVRKILAVLMKEQTLSDETLLTLMCEVESTINSRPITVVSQDPKDLEPLTPNHLLLMRGQSAPSVSEVDRRNAYCRRWKQVQYLATLFWRRWTKEYLPALQQRNKWTNSKSNLKVNDVVIVTDEALPRNIWPVGRVLAVFPGDDGLVRSAQVKTATSTLMRPVSKLCLLETVD